MDEVPGPVTLQAEEEEPMNQSGNEELKANRYTPEDYRRLNRAVDRLDEIQFETVRLRFIEHSTIEEVGAELGMNWDRTDAFIDEALRILRLEWKPEELRIPKKIPGNAFPPCLLAAVGVR